MSSQGTDRPTKPQGTSESAFLTDATQLLPGGSGLCLGRRRAFGKEAIVVGATVLQGHCWGQIPSIVVSTGIHQVLYPHLPQAEVRDQHDNVHDSLCISMVKHWEPSHLFKKGLAAIIMSCVDSGKQSGKQAASTARDSFCNYWCFGELVIAIFKLNLHVTYPNRRTRDSWFP